MLQQKESEPAKAAANGSLEEKKELTLVDEVEEQMDTDAIVLSEEVGDDEKDVKEEPPKDNATTGSDNVEATK